MTYEPSGAYDPGKIMSVKEIRCGGCEDGDQLPMAYDAAVRQWRREGWVKTVARGWVCPSCAEARNESDGDGRQPPRA